MVLISMDWYFDGLVQEKHNSIANTLELCISYTNPSIRSLDSGKFDVDISQQISSQI